MSADCDMPTAADYARHEAEEASRKAEKNQRALDAILERLAKVEAEVAELRKSSKS